MSDVPDEARRAAQIVNGHRIVDEAINGNVICDCGSRFATPLDHAGHVVSIMREAGPLDSAASAKAYLEAHGYVVLKATSYRRAQERQRLAEARRDWEVERREHTEQWAHEAFAEQRRLSDRLTFVYGVARACGASVEDLAARGVVGATTGGTNE